MDAHWNQSEKVCAITGSEKNRDSVIVTLCADVVFLLAMLGGVVRQIKDGPIWRITYYQVSFGGSFAPRLDTNNKM